jgi:transcriptional regulator with XRE-family HTH domain
MGGKVLFWENVKTEIKRQNTTQEWVAKKAGISFNTFQGWISKGIYPRANEAVHIAAALNTSVEYLVTGTSWNMAVSVNKITAQIPPIIKHLEVITEVVRELR